jgi:hypothetical protein
MLWDSCETCGSGRDYGGSPRPQELKILGVAGLVHGDRRAGTASLRLSPIWSTVVAIVPRTEPWSAEPLGAFATEQPLFCLQERSRV